MAILFGGAEPFVQISEHKGHFEGHVIDYFEFGPVVQEEMPFKYSSYIQLWWPSCLVEWNH